MTTRRRESDRLSALPDETLERILSHLASDEAARTTALSRRWRDVHAAVPVVDLVDPKKGNRDCPNGGNEKVCFDQQVTGAILCKAPGTRIGTFRLIACHPPRDLLDQWIITAATSGAEEIDVKLRYYHASTDRLCPFGSSEEASADFNQRERNLYTKTPRQLFTSCATLRRLCLTNWTLDLPAWGMPVTAAAALEMLCLKRIMDPNRVLHQLVSSCRRLADLTLEECPSVREISVPSTHLRSFTMICCHHARRVKLHSPCLQSLHYRGGLPRESFFKIANYAGVMALKIEICEDLSRTEPWEVTPVTTLISRCTNLTYLHLSLRPQMAYYSSLFTDAVRRLPRLRQLGLQGSLSTDHAVRSVAVLLRDTQNLEVLSLFPVGPPKKKQMFSYFADDESDKEPEDVSDDDGVDYSSRVTDSLWRMYIRCLDHKLRRINIGNYKGRQLEKILAKFLLSNAAALEELSVTLTAGRHEHEIARELRSWRLTHRTRVTVNIFF